jgi:hypothetical protein
MFETGVYFASTSSKRGPKPYMSGYGMGCDNRKPGFAKSLLVFFTSLLKKRSHFKNCFFFFTEATWLMFEVRRSSENQRPQIDEDKVMWSLKKNVRFFRKKYSLPLIF